VNLEREMFLAMIQDYVQKDPGCIPYIFKSVEIGTNDFISNAKEQAMDYENCLFRLLGKFKMSRVKRMEFVKEIMMKYVDKNKTFSRPETIAEMFWEGGE